MKPKFGSKVDYLYPGVDPKLRGQLLLDNVALYSVTDERTADAISRRLLKFVPATSEVTNATACVGGNTWSFAKHFRGVHAIERDPVRFKYLVHNMNVLGTKNVRASHGDALKILLGKRGSVKSGTKLDMVFMDPPWGGPGFKDLPKVSLFLSDKKLSTVVDELAHSTRFIAVKVPVNFDITQFVKDIKMVTMVLHERFKKMHLLVLQSRSNAVP